MNSRNAGLDWFRKNRLATAESIKVSKCYPPGESATQRAAWWFEFSDAEVIGRNVFINLLCQKMNEPEEFHHLRVPSGFVMIQKPLLGYRMDKSIFSLYLSAERDSLFRELRGMGKVEFSKFEILQP